VSVSSAVQQKDWLYGVGTGPVMNVVVDVPSGQSAKSKWSTTEVLLTGAVSHLVGCKQDGVSH